MFKRLLLAFGVLCLGLTGTWAFSQKPKQEINKERVDYIVKLKKGVDPERLKEVFDPYKIEEIKNVSGTVYRIKFKEDPGLKELQRLIKERGNMGIVEPNYKVLMTNPMEQNER
jgi:hypothetical protein